MLIDVIADGKTQRRYFNPGAIDHDSAASMVMVAGDASRCWISVKHGKKYEVTRESYETVRRWMEHRR